MRTKVLIVVGALVLLGAVAPNEDSTRENTPTTSATSKDGPDAKDSPVAETGPDEVQEDAEPAMARVPELRTKRLDGARKRLRHAELAIRVIKQPSWKPAGVVLAQRTPAGTKVNPGRVITLVVAVAMPAVPGVVGKTSTIGIAALRRAGFKTRTIKEVVTSGANGVILRQDPAGTNRAAPGSVVQVVVSNLVRPVVAPAPASNCTPGYSPCLAPASDYDCAGGSGNGPKYANGPVRVTGSDPYALDADGDGVACE